MPYTDNGEEKVIYSLFPFTIKSVLNNDLVVLKSDPRLKGYHGSTNGIDYNGKKLFMAHLNKHRTYHRWILFDPATNDVTYSEVFIIFRYSWVEFTCSLARFGNRIFVSAGVDDDKAFILETAIEDIDMFFNINTE
jgi:hypothetical protein